MVQFIFFFLSFCYIQGHADSENSYQALVNKNLIQIGDKPSLHLGSGESYLPGYINIDLPFTDRPLHTKNGPDYFCNILDLRFPFNSIEKIENHHMFEHFSRPVSLALLCAWGLWLDSDGELLIETPDFENAIKRYLSTPSFQSQQIIIRHLFGSHEADWAYHYDGWYYEKFKHTLSAFGFVIEDVKYNFWQNTDNIIIKAKKIHTYSPSQIKQIAYDLLQLSCVDQSLSEYKMWKGWCNDFDNAFSKMICPL